MSNTNEILLEHKLSLQGYAIGYEILEAGKVVKKHTYDTPVKNLVVSTGKDAFMAPNSYTSGNYQAGQTYGCPLGALTQYLARGSGSTPAAAGNTQLEAQIGNRTNQLLAGDPYTGVRYDKSTGVIYLRKTFDSESETGNQNINEVGMFTSASAGVMFCRIVLPSTATVLIGQQLRLTYELQVTIYPSASISYSPTITGWTTTGDAQLQGLFPNTSATFASLPNQFIGVWDTQGKAVSLTGSVTQQLLVEPSSSGNYNGIGQVVGIAGTASRVSYLGITLWQTKTLDTFGVAQDTPSSNPPAISIGGFLNNNSSGTVTNTVEAYSAGTFYRDQRIILEPNFPSVSISPIAFNCRGLTHVMDVAQTKTNTQRLTLTYRVTLT